MSDLHGCPVNISYLYAMKKDELIELLKEQIKGLRDDNNRLLVQIDALTKEVSSLKEALLQKGESLGKQQRIAKGLAKLVSNTSERQQAPRPALSEEERRKAEAEKAAGRKARKNNGARRDMHYELEEEEHVVYPDDPGFDINKARLFTPTPRICVRYECWKSHSTLTLLATQDLPTFLYYMIDPLKSWCWGAILFYPFKNSRFS